MNTPELQENLESTPLQVTSPIGKIRQYVRSHLLETMGVTVAGSLLLTVVSVGNMVRTYQGFQSTVTQQFELQKQADTITYVDEVLTMSTRMAASTGDPKWEKRYNDFVPLLDDAIASTLDNVTDEIRAEASKTDAANQALIDMETQAFELVRAGQESQALQLLLGPKYGEQKKIYAAGNAKVIADVEAYIDAQLDSYRQRFQLSIGFAVGTFPLLLLGWLLVLSAVRDYIEERRESQAALKHSQQELSIINYELCQEAEARRKQEENMRAESEQLQEDIGELLDVVCDIEEGDLTVQAKVNDRATGLVSDTMNRLVESLGSVLLQVNDNTKEVTQSGQQQKQIAAVVAESTEQQTQAVNKALELTTMVRHAANSAANQLDTTKQSLLMLQGTVVNGQATMQHLTADIDVLRQGSDRIVQQMKTLGEFVGQTDQFVLDQSEIAAETQVLALNASLVAARAAEQRDPQKFARVARDFEMIANQVSQLAQQTNDGLTTLEQRSAQIHQVVSDVDTNVQSLGALVEDFNRGVQQTEMVFQNVQQVTGQAVEAGDAVVQTSQSIVESSATTTQRMQAISDFSRQIAQQSQQAREVSDAMNTLSLDLLKKVQVFKLPEGPETPTSTASASKTSAADRPVAVEV